MDLTLAVTAYKKVDENNFTIGYQQIFKNSFIEEDLHFWCDVTGISVEKARINLINKGWKYFGWDVYIYDQIKTSEEFSVIRRKYNLSYEEVLKKVIRLVDLNKGDYKDISREFPLSQNLIFKLLRVQNELVPIMDKWIPTVSMPSQVLELSKVINSRKMMWDELIISTIVKENIPLRLEEIIFKSIGITTASIHLKLIVNFMLNVLPTTKVRETEYWILDEWTNKIDTKLISSLIKLLSEHEVLSITEINTALPNFQITKILSMLQFWPEFREYEKDSYKLNISPLDDAMLALVIPTIREVLSINKSGIKIATLFSYVIETLESQGLKIKLWDLKLFLKSWGEVAIVGSNVYEIESAPFKSMRLGDVAYLILKEAGSPMLFTELEAEIKMKRNYFSSISSVLLAEPKLSRPSRGYWALKEWGLAEYDPQIHSRIGDILVLLIEEENRPLHKSEIHRHLRRRGMNMNETTLYLDLTENLEIAHVARGVYSLKKWNLSFRDLFRYKFPFKLTLPDNNSAIYELEGGIMLEYFISRNCLNMKRILVNRHIKEYFVDLEQYEKYHIVDHIGSQYVGWIDCLDDGRFQILGLERWYQSYKPRYGEIVYIFIPENFKNTFTLYTLDQVDSLLYGS